MKHLFPEYYRPTEDEFAQMWSECIFVFDANILLNLYRTTDHTREELLKILKKLSDRIWIPHQVAFEYTKNRIDEIIDKQNAYEKTIKSLNGIKEAISPVSNDLKQYKGRHPYLDIEGLLDRIDKFLSKLERDVKKLAKDHPNWMTDDPILDALENLFVPERIGSPYPDEEQQKIEKEGENRYKQKQPPGYEDGIGNYGDLILWHQIMDYAKAQQKPIILVIDDRKKDWWREISGKTIGPRPELIREFLNYTQVKFYMYSSQNFIVYANQYVEKIENLNEVAEELRELTVTRLNELLVLGNLPYPSSLNALSSLGLSALASAVSSLTRQERLPENFARWTQPLLSSVVSPPIALDSVSKALNGLLQENLSQTLITASITAEINKMLEAEASVHGAGDAARKVVEQMDAEAVKQREEIQQALAEIEEMHRPDAALLSSLSIEDQIEKEKHHLKTESGDDET